MTSNSISTGNYFWCLVLSALLLVHIHGESVAQPSKSSASGSGSEATRPTPPPGEIVIPELIREGLDEKTAAAVKIIDRRLDEVWKSNKVQPADICTDLEFMRRVTLDLLGRIAKLPEMMEYMKQPEKSRRAWLVDQLLASEEYPRNWGNIWATWLLTRSAPFGRGRYRDEMRKWVEDQYAVNAKHDEFATKLITAKGRGSVNGSVHFLMAHMGEPVPQASQAEEGQFEMTGTTARVTRLFLGIQTQCTQCHDHPFDKRLQSEFWGVNAFLRQVVRSGDPNGGGELELLDSSNNKSGSVNYEKRNGVILETSAIFLDGKKPAKTADRRTELAKFVVAHENFSKAYVNRMWSHFFGRGFVNPIDDFNSQNQVNHPELLNDLAKMFVQSGYDSKALIRWICNSKAYNLRSVANSTNDKPEHEVLFSRALLRVMTPEQMFESILVATDAAGVKTKDARNALEQRWMDVLVSNFGDDEGNEVSFNGTVVQALLLINGEDINNAITDGEGTVAKMVKANGPGANKVQTESNITALFVVTLNRKPSNAEMTKISKALPLLPGSPKRDKDVNSPWHDLLWALLNSNEFILNH